MKKFRTEKIEFKISGIRKKGAFLITMGTNYEEEKYLFVNKNLTSQEKIFLNNNTVFEKDYKHYATISICGSKGLLLWSKTYKDLFIFIEIFKNKESKIEEIENYLKKNKFLISELHYPYVGEYDTSAIEYTAEKYPLKYDLQKCGYLNPYVGKLIIAGQRQFFNWNSRQEHGEIFIGEDALINVEQNPILKDKYSVILYRDDESINILIAHDQLEVLIKGLHQIREYKIEKVKEVVRHMIKLKCIVYVYHGTSREDGIVEKDIKDFMKKAVNY